MHVYIFKLAGHLRAQTKRDIMCHGLTLALLLNVTFLYFLTFQFANLIYTDVCLLNLLSKSYLKTVHASL